MSSVEELVTVTSEEPTTCHEFYKRAGVFVLASADCNSLQDYVGARLYMGIAQSEYQRGHAINPLFNNDQPHDLGE